MSALRRVAIAGLVAAAALGTAPAAAPADLLAVTETQGAGGDLDLAYIDVSTGQRMTLPAGVNTAADEFHPSLSPDGKQLVFERVDAAAGTTRFVLVDLGSGVSSDLLSAFQVAALTPRDPTFTSSSRVALARPLTTFGSGTQREANRSLLSTSPFPNGPYQPVDAPFGPALHGSGQTLQIDSTGLVAGVHVDGQNGGVVITGSHIAGDPNQSFDDPTESDEQQVIVFERAAVNPNGSLAQGQLVFTPLSLHDPAPLPAIVQPQPGSGSVTRPEFSDDGRYLAFVREHNGLGRLFVWDSQTTLLLDDAGADLGTVPIAKVQLLRVDGAVALHKATLVLSSFVRPSGAITFNLAALSSIGIIVQKVVGHTRVLGRRAPKLRLVGRVPLGRFRRGRGGVRWNLKVNGRALGPGQYQVTVRSVTSRGRLRDLGRPVLIRIRARGR